MRNRGVLYCFLFIVCLALLTPFLVFRDLLFPFVTSKAFYLRILIELALPLYVYLLLAEPHYRPSFKNPLTIAVSAFFVFSLASAFTGVTPIKSLWGNFERMGGVFYLGHLTLLYFYVLLLGQARASLLRIFLQALVVIGVAVSVDGALVFLTHNHFLLNDPSYPRVSGTFGNPIYIASFLVIPMLISVFLGFGVEAWWKKTFYFSAALLQMWIIFLSGTRGAVVGMGIGIFAAAVLYVILAPSKKVRLLGGLSLLVFSCIVGALFALHNHLPPASMLHRVFNLKDSNTEARLIQWKIALHGFPEHAILGVGPENYYILSNKFYNPQIYQYDPSWFDKPHNYLIEVLVTGGVVGFAAYAAMLIFCLWAFWRSYRKDIVGLAEFCVLVCALFAYEVQNLFVFDTVAASIAFFIFVGLAGVLWHESRTFKNNKKPKKVLDFAPAFNAAAVGLTIVASGYSLIVFNIDGMRAAKDVNYGFAYAQANPQTAENYFQSAVNGPFNFDPLETANKYAEFASGLAQNPGSTPQNLVDEILGNAVAAENAAIAKISNDPVTYAQLTSLYISQALYHKQAPGPEATTAIQMSMSLAPLRPDPALSYAQLQIYQNNLSGAQKTLEQVVKDVPSDTPAKLQLGQFYFYTGQVSLAKNIAEAVLSSSFVPTQVAQIDWIGQLYAKLEDYPSAVKIYEQALQIDPNNINDYWQLAQLYPKVGKATQAMAMAQVIAKYDPTRAKEMQDFIDSIQATAQK